MAQLLANCPRCSAQKITFDLRSIIMTDKVGWRYRAEAFAVCRHCNRSTTFFIAQKHPNYEGFFANINNLLNVSGTINEYVDENGYLSLQHMEAMEAPEHLPEPIDAAFKEGAACWAIKCHNAAAAMFRLCVDHATKSMLPPEGEEPNAKVRRSLGLRLEWLFTSGRLPEALKELSSCIKEDGNDGAHDGTLTAKDTEDLIDFTFALLERIYTEPEKLRLAKDRRTARRGS